MLSLKPITALTVIACLLTGLHTYAQQEKVTLSYKNAPLSTILADIKNQTGLGVFYERPNMRLTHNVTIHVVDAPLKDALDICFKDQPVEWLMNGPNITVQLKGKSLRAPPGEERPVLIKGAIINESGEPVPGATVLIKGTTTQVGANSNGEFSIAADSNAYLVISSVNYETQEIALAGKTEVGIRLRKAVAELNQAIVSTGYQKLNGGGQTGSYAKIDGELLNRRVSPNVIDRIDGIASGLLVNKNVNTALNQSAISIRGRSTIYANPNPLIVVDNFPYAGDISNINPADVESITILKDAAAASIWGALSGNGVIVITTKKGKYNQPARVSFTTSVTVGEKPDLWYTPVMSSSDYISVEQYLFGQGYYNDWPNDPAHRVISPAVEIMFARGSGQISAADSAARIDALRQVDRRNDLNDYFYRRSVSQQYALNLSGGYTNHHYYLSAGYDKSLLNTVGNSSDRLTLNANNTYALLKQKLELNTGIVFTAGKSMVNSAAQLPASYPYAQLAGADGTPLTVYTGFRQPYKDTAGGGNLLNWDYKPLDELHLSDDVTRLIDYRININARYLILKGWDIAANYQYNKGNTDERNYRSQGTYFTRDLINQYTQPGFMRAIPLGGIFDKTLSDYESYNIRLQSNYSHAWKDEHELTAIAGAELRSLETDYAVSRLYGYDKDRQTNIKVDYNANYSLYPAPFVQTKIPMVDVDRSTTDHYISFYGNAVYTWKHRYIVSASARRDESNLVGVNTNQKGVPLWSAGLGWIVNKENFYRCDWLPYLKLRVADGSNGNVDRTASAYTTIAVSNANNLYGAPSASFVSPSNSQLRWEKMNMLNAGVDFAFKHDRVSGSLEYYIKNGADLIGYALVDPTTGFSNYKGNTADMTGKGLDLVLHIRSNEKSFRWYGDLLLSYATDKVTSYKVKQANISYYFNPNVFNPLEGNPLYSIYAFKWMGLDSQTGDPLGRVKGNASRNYNDIISSTNFGDMVYMGPVNPTVFGSLRNTFDWKQLELSFNITWKFGYYFKRPSITYDDLFKGLSQGSPDFDKRWQKTGDEKITDIPSMPYPGDANRDLFYRNSEVLVEKGDQIRLQDIRLGYAFSKGQAQKLRVRGAQLYIYANNIGLLWRANDKGIDPDYLTGVPNPRTVAIGATIDF